MNIAYLGNFTQKHCTEVHLANTLEDLGHSVIRIQENGFTQDELGKLIENEQFDLFLFTRTWGETLTLEHIEQLRKRGIPSASYHLDLYVGLTRKYLHGNNSLDQMLQTDPFWRTDFVFTPDGDAESAKVFERNGVKHYYMKPGVYKPECLIYPKSEKSYDAGGFYTHYYDVLFVGGGDRPGSEHAYGHPEWNYRNELIGWLYDTYGYRFTKFGHPQETIRNEALNQLYADTKVVVGDSVCIGFNHTYYWSDRVCETLGRGGFLIHPYIKGMEEEFIDGEHLVYYEFGNFEQLKEKIDYYLEHDDEREKIRRAGHEFVKNHATYNDRLKLMLEIIKAGKAVDIMSAEGYDLLQANKNKPIKINLGAGLEPTEGWINTDWVEGKGIDKVFNLLDDEWPFNDGIADEIKAIDVLEHMPNYTASNKSTPIHFVEECHRILQTGGTLTIQVPHYQSPNLWIDPTHVRGYDPKSMDYFDPETDLGKWYGYYSNKKFRVTAEVSKYNDPDGFNVGLPSNITFAMVKL